MLYEEQRSGLMIQTDRMMAGLMVVELLSAVLLTLVGEGTSNLRETAVLVGGLIAFPPILLVLSQPGTLLTRCTMAVGQTLFSALLIHLTGGRIESHFHIFVILAFLAFYRDWRVFIPATLTVIGDHGLRGLLYPLSVYGVDQANLWRTIEHTGWVVFEVMVLTYGCVRSQAEMQRTALAMAQLEAINTSVESTIVERTAELEESRGLAQLRVEELERVLEERRVLEDQLRHVQKMEAVGLLAGGVAHDFNNMLSVIDGFAELMSMTDTAEQKEESLGEIRKAVQRSSGLVKQLMTFARKDQVRPEVLDLEAAVSETVSMLRVLIGENIELEWRRDGALSPIEADKAHLTQILTNLTINARDAIEGAGRVVVETSMVTVETSLPSFPGALTPGRYVRLSVGDNGSGMTAEVKERALDPFFTTKARGCGTGLGLSTVYGIVKQNGGTLSIASEPGKGTTVTVFLPASEEAPPPESQQSGPCPSGSETILVVEDEAALLGLTVRFLRRAGYRVLAAGRPSEALELSRTYGGVIDLLVTDVIMPEMDGGQLACKLRTNRPGLCTLYMSGYTASVVLDQESEFLAKPFGMAELGKAVRQALARQRRVGGVLA